MTPMNYSYLAAAIISYIRDMYDSVRVSENESHNNKNCSNFQVKDTHHGISVPANESFIK